MTRSSSKTFINDFTSGPVLRTLAIFALPLLLSNVLQSAYGIVDMVVVGQVVGENGLAGLSIGGDILSFLTFISLGFSIASQTIIAQYIGAGWRERLSRFIGTMATFLFLCAVTISIVCLLLRKHILTWLNTPATAWDQAMAYSVTCMCGLVFIYGYNIVSAILRGMGDSKRPFLFIAIAAIINVLLDLLFVAVFHWEAFGAALATVLAQAFSFLASLVYLYKKRANLGFDFSLSHLRINRQELLVLIRMGIPFAFSMAAISTSRLFVNGWVNSYGVTVSAVTGVGYKVDMFVDQMGYAIASAGSSMTGQNIGAGKYDRVKKIMGAALCLNSIIFVVVCIIMGLFPQSVYGLFTKDAAVLATCMEYLPTAFVTFTASTLRHTTNTFALGCGNYKFNFTVAILDGIAARVGLSLLLGVPLGLGYLGFWYGNAIASSIPFFMGIVYFLSGRWKKSASILSPAE